MEQSNQDNDERLREIEQDLINRIADVDDDRRRAAAALHRMVDNHVEKMDEKLRRSNRMSTFFAALAGVLALVALGLGLNQPLPGGAKMATAPADPKHPIAPLTSNSGKDALLRDKLAELSKSVSAISDSLEVLDMERAERQEADKDLGARLDDMAGEIAGLRAASSEAASDSEPLPTTVEDEAQAHPEQPESAATRQPSAPAPAVVESPEPNIVGAAPAEAPADQSEAEEPMTSAPTMGLAADGRGSQAPTTDATTDTPNADGNTAIPTPAEEEASAPAPPANKPSLVLDERRYALQLIGFYDLDTLRGFARRNNLPSPLYYRRENLRGRSWYVLIHSLHGDPESAATARSTLPSDLSTLDTWIRPLSEGAELEVLELAGNAP